MVTRFEHLTLSDHFSYIATTQSEDIFVRYVDPDAPGTQMALTYGEIATQVRQFSGRLWESGVRAGDRVVIHFPNSIEFIVAWLATLELDAVAVPTIIHYSQEEFDYVLDHSEAVAAVVGPKYEKIATTSLRRDSADFSLFIGLEEAPRGSISRAGESRTQIMRQGMPNGEQIAQIMYTSGTTSRPKGVMLSHRACLEGGQVSSEHIRLRPDDVQYCVLPLFHANAMFFHLVPTLCTGSELVISPRFSTSAYWSVVRRTRTTIGNLTAGTVRTLMDRPPSEVDPDHPLRMMMYALPLSGEEIVSFESRFGVALSMGWGLTESATGGTRTPMYMDRRPKWQSIGCVSAGWDVRVVGEDGAECPIDSVGELVIRGPGLMTGYFKDSLETGEALRDEWLWTGDLGFFDEDGYVFFHDRKKDIVKVKGENVAASEVERVVEQVDGVHECGVVGVPDPIWEEKLVAYVELEPGEQVSLETLRTRCEERLAAFKVPYRFEIVEELPRTSIGKIRKGTLRDQARVHFLGDE